VRVGLDATPLLGPRTGVGQYAANLISSLAALPDRPDLRLVPFTWRGAADLPAHAPRGPGISVSTRRAPARLLREVWARWPVPPVEWLAGPVDVFHGTNFVLPPARRAAGVVTVHDLAYELFPETVTAASRRYRELVPRALRRAAVLVTVAAATADDLAQFYRFERSQIVVTPLGVDPGWAAAIAPDAGLRARLGLPERYLVFVGAAEPRKNLPVLLAAHARLRASHPETPPLVLVGPAGWGARTTPAADGSVLRLGYLDSVDVPRVVAGAAALVLPSRYEGFGLTALEALACGTPVVASDLPVIREVTGGLAELVPVGDVDAMADALARLLADDGGPPARAVRRAHAAGWTWQRCAERTLDAYRLAVTSA